MKLNSLPPVFQPFITDWLDYLESQRGRARSTLAEYRRDLVRVLRHLSPGPDLLAKDIQRYGPITAPADITTDHLAAVLVHFRHEHSYANKTLARKIAAIKSCFAWARSSYRIATDPAAGLEIPSSSDSLPRDLTGPSVKSLLAQLQGDDWLTVRDRSIIQLMLHTGLRVSEVAHLDLDDLDFTRDQLTVRHPSQIQRTKNRRERVVPLNRVAKTALADWLDVRAHYEQPATEAVFVAQRSRRRLSTRAIQHAVEKHSQAAGLRGVTPHTLRHTFGTRLLAAGANLRQVQKLLGHTSPTTTAMYTHIHNRELHDAVASLAGSPVDRLADTA
jgi:site-specific recombinase XerD